MRNPTKTNRIITPGPLWVLVRKRAGDVYPHRDTESNRLGWPGIYPTRDAAQRDLDRLTSDWMIRKVIPRLEVLDHA